MVEAEDVPEEVTAALLGQSYLYELTPFAVRFARRLAQASMGVVLDQQTGQVWARGKLRTAPPVSRGSIAIVGVTWYVRPGGTGAASARARLDLARRHLPEALPRRFGSYEPLSFKLDVDGPDAFMEAAARETSFLSYKASAPCIGGHLAGGGGGPGVHSHTLSVHRKALEDGGGASRCGGCSWPLPSRPMLSSPLLRSSAVWSGRGGAPGIGPTERTTYLAARGQWAGLIPYPPWWCWFGADYVRLVIDHLPAEQVSHERNGLFHARGEEPLDRDQLTSVLIASPAAPRPRRTLRDLIGRRNRRAPASAWLPPELLPVAHQTDLDTYSPSLTQAASIPAALRVTR